MLIEWEKDFPVRIYEAGRNGHVSLPNLLNFFQDAASGHASHLGVGFPQLEPRGLGWFVTRQHMKISRYPIYGETIRIKTWPKSKKRLFALRDFEMFVKEERVAVGSSVWCLVDLGSKTPMNVNETLPGLPENPRDAMLSNFPRISLPENMSHDRRFSPRKSEIDMNGHVNNAVYVNWALESLSPLSERKQPVSEVVAFFKHEIGMGQDVTARAAFSGKEKGCSESFHCLTEEGADREVFRMRLTWG